MPRKKEYADDAARAAAYRARTVRVERAAVEELLAAVNAAAEAGDELARRVGRVVTVDALLRNLARVMRERAAAARERTTE